MRTSTIFRAIKIYVYIYDNATSITMTGRTSKQFRIERGGKLGDLISPKLFNAVLEDMFRRLYW